jgi:tetratricopeptide (TPR) repeat protein
MQINKEELDRYITDERDSLGSDEPMSVEEEQAILDTCKRYRIVHARMKYEELPSWAIRVATNIATLEAAKQQAERLLEDLTPGGSEFHGEPQACYDFIKQTMQTKMMGMIAHAQARQQAEDRLAEAVRLLEKAKNDVNWCAGENAYGNIQNALADLSQELEETIPAFLEATPESVKARAEYVQACVQLAEITVQREAAGCRYDELLDMGAKLVRYNTMPQPIDQELRQVAAQQSDLEKAIAEALAAVEAAKERR